MKPYAPSGTLETPLTVCASPLTAAGDMLLFKELLDSLFNQFCQESLLHEVDLEKSPIRSSTTPPTARCNLYNASELPNGRSSSK